jgi:hypothetical protein
LRDAEWSGPDDESRDNVQGAGVAPTVLEVSAT